MTTQNKVLVLRICNSDLTSRNGFQWKPSGVVKAPDWDPKPECGNGLHGALWGQGDGSLFNWDIDAKWLVVEVDSSTIVDLNGKVKFPEGEVVFCGDRKEATDFIAARAPLGTVIIGYNAVAGDNGSAVSGYRGTSSSGTCGTSSSGTCGISSSGAGGTSSSGTCGTSSSGHYGTSSSGAGGTSSSGDYGTSSSGDYGMIQIKWWDEKSSRYRITTGYVGEKGIEANTAYRCDSKGKLVKA